MIGPDGRTDTFHYKLLDWIGKFKREKVNFEKTKPSTADRLVEVRANFGRKTIIQDFRQAFIEKTH